MAAGNQTITDRKPHVSKDIHSRNLKGLKIERLLELAGQPQPIHMLEVGTGSGGIAHYFGTHPTLRCEVCAVDVCDNRLLRNGYTFRRVAGVELPYADASFGVVISNHVIEHVGDASAQLRHLAELRRVLKDDGVGYLAVPNRWMLTEPHYQLKFLSWWPRAWRSAYLRLMGKGDFYDCEPLQTKELERMLGAAGLHYHNLCIEASRATFQIEHSGSFATRLLCALPDAALIPLKRIIPTLIYRVQPSGDRGESAGNAV